MDSETDVIDRLSSISKLKMSQKRQQEIWCLIQAEMDQAEPGTMRRHPYTLLKTGIAIVVGLVICSGGIYTLYSKELLQSNISQHQITATKEPSNPVINGLSSINKQNLMSALKHVSFRYSLPSWLPYTPTLVSGSGWDLTPASTRFRSFMVDFMGPIVSGEQQDVHLQETLGKPDSSTFQGTKVTLDSGVTAYFNAKDPNGYGLYWYQNGITYVLSAAKVDVNTRALTGDLNKTILLKIANSFK